MYYSLDLMSDASERVPYVLPDYPAFAARGPLSVYRDMRSPSHWHDDLEFGIILAGRMVYAVNGEELELAEGEGIFINARQLHSHYSADGDDCEYLCVLLHPSLLCPNPYLAESCISPITENAGFPHCVLRPDVLWQADLMACAREIQEAFDAFGPKAALQQQSLAYRMALLLLSHLPAGETAVRVDLRLGALRGMVGFVQHHYDEKITLGEIARASGVSESTCHALFRKHLRQTPMGYLTRYRLEKGMELLGQPDLSVTEIALATGFSSPSYFTECFRKHIGLTPTEYRMAQ